MHEISKRKANWIGYILHRNCLLQRVIEGKIKGEMEVIRRRGRRRRKLLDDLKERRGYSDLITDKLMLYREIIAVFSAIHTKHKYTVWAECRIVGC